MVGMTKAKAVRMTVVVVGNLVGLSTDFELVCESLAVFICHCKVDVVQ